MNSPLDPHLPEITRLCRGYGVTSLHAFGSVLRPDFRPDGDIDLLVGFDESSAMNAFQRFFGFKEALEQLLGHPVDLVTWQSLSNPHFKMELEETIQKLYAA